MRRCPAAVVVAFAFISGCAAEGHVAQIDSDSTVRMIRLVDGSVVRGVPVASYDHSTWWWDASPEITYAFFDPTAASAKPGEDRSLRFVDQSRISPGQPTIVVPVAATPSSYRSWTQSSGITLQMLPLRGVAQVLNGHERWHHDEGGFGDFAWDLVATFEDGARSRAPGTAVTDYAIWDAPVYLPTAGWVVDVDDSAPDNAPGMIPPGPMKSIVNNMIGVELSGSYYVYLLHFRQGSIPRAERGTCEPAVPGVTCIEPGRWLPRGTYLGRVGNSGVTYEPHLHVTAYFWDTERTPARSWSVPIEFSELEIRRAASAITAHETWVVPATGDAISNDPF